MNKLFALLVFMMFSSFAYGLNKGGIFFEPIVTYERGDSKINYPSPINDSTGKIQGLGVGTRLGFHLLESLFFGVDGRYSMPSFKDSSLNQNARARSWNYGPMVGVQMPFAIGLRFWGSYIMGGELDPDSSKNVDAKFKNGKGFRLGGGIKLGVTSLNLEYQAIKYDETQIQQAGVFAPGTSFRNVDLKNNSVVFSVSFPFSL